MLLAGLWLPPFHRHPGIGCLRLSSCSHTQTTSAPGWVSGDLTAELNRLPAKLARLR